MIAQYNQLADEQNNIVQIKKPQFLHIIFVARINIRSTGQITRIKIK
jgi:hypothetical protein